MDAPGRCENGGQSHRPGNFIDLISYEHIAANKFTFANKSAKVNCTLHLANHTAQHFRANIDVWEQASQPALDRPELANDHRARSSIIRSHAKHVEWGHQLVGHGCASRLGVFGAVAFKHVGFLMMLLAAVSCSLEKSHSKRGNPDRKPNPSIASWFQGGRTGQRFKSTYFKRFGLPAHASRDSSDLQAALAQPT